MVKETERIGIVKIKRLIKHPDITEEICKYLSNKKFDCIDISDEEEWYTIHTYYGTLCISIEDIEWFSCNEREAKIDKLYRLFNKLPLLSMSV